MQLLRLVSGAVSGKINLCYGLTDTRTHPGQTISSGKIKYNAMCLAVSKIFGCAPLVGANAPIETDSGGSGGICCQFWRDWP